MANQTQPQQPTATLLPGLFGLPQGSLPLYGHDTTIDLPVTLGPTTQVQQQLKNVQNTDVIANYRLNVNLNVTAPTNSTTPSDVAASNLQPYSALQNVTLSIQNVFNSLNTNGIDLATKNILWPWSKGARYDAANLLNAPYPAAFESKPYGSGGGGLPNAYLYYDLGPAQYFDHYYEVDLATGRAISVNGVISQRIYAGVQYMGGTTRVIVPSLTFSPILGSNPNQAFYTGTATANGSGTATLTLDREGWFSQTSPAKMPAITNWVPQFTTSFITIGAATEWVYEIPKSYQVLGLVFRFFDPSTGQAPSIIPRATVQVGSGIQLFDGSGITIIKRMYDQFDLLANFLPAGTYVFDFSHNHNGELTNAHAINTYVTNGCIVKFQLPSGGSDQFGCYVSVYGLQYVNQGSGL
jgi:hypothetical protein